MKNQLTKQATWEALTSNAEPKALLLKVKEHECAFRDLYLMAQESVKFSHTTLNGLVEFKNKKSRLLFCGGRIQSFREEKTAEPILPHEAYC